MSCEHPRLAVRQDPKDQRRELLVCPDCSMEPKSRVSVAASMKEQAEKELAEMQTTIERNEESRRQDAMNRAEAEAAMQASLSALIARINSQEARIAKLESFGGVP